MSAAQEYLIHLRAMSTGMNHPQAVVGVLSSIPNPVNRGCNFIIQIMDQFLAILFHTVTGRSQDQLFIWNWMTGELVTVCHDPTGLRRRLAHRVLGFQARSNKQNQDRLFLVPVSTAFCHYTVPG